jgi:Protein of unknown function (DUF3631)
VIEPVAAPLHGRLALWAENTVEALRDARPSPPDDLTDRQQDCAEQLVAIADAAGGEWPELGERQWCNSAPKDERTMTRLAFDAE